jgi:hypothetical protein
MTLFSDEVVDRNYELLTRRRADNNRRELATANAVTARKVVQAFDEFGRALSRSAKSRGSEVDHAVTLDLARVCEQRVERFTQLAEQYERIAQGDAL